MQSNSADINQLCECAICKDHLEDAHICPKCSNPCCRKCIMEWLRRNNVCPICRSVLTKDKLVKVRIYEQVQEVLKSRSVISQDHKAELIPELSVFKIDIQADQELEFQVEVSPVEKSMYSVALCMTKGTAGEYLVALEKGPLVPIKLELGKEMALGRVKPESTPPSITIKIQLAKTDEEDFRTTVVAIREQLLIKQEHIHRLIESNVFLSVLLLVAACIGMTALKA